MDAYLHTFLAVGCMLGAYVLGQHIATKELMGQQFIDDAVEHILKMLEKDGFIQTETKDDEIELIPISEIVTEALEKQSGKKST